MTDPKLIENKTASVLINLFNKNDINDQIKLAKMQPWEREMCLGLEPFDRGYGETHRIDTDENGFGS